MITRNEYLADRTEGAHSRYYGQFVDSTIMRDVLWTISRDRIATSTDEHFNDIPLRYWDAVPITYEASEKLKAAGDYLTAAGRVCIAKEAARQMREVWQRGDQ